jgi:8-oxo-dGTP pyrophosphatase MutT (NUDIX family)
MPPPTPTDVVTVFLTRGPELLVLRRSERVGTYRGRWAGVAGYLEAVPPEAQARVELAEELGLLDDDVELLAAGAPVVIDDPAAARSWRVHPFRFELRPGASPRLDWEHVELRWIRPEEIAALETVPGLWKAWQNVAGGA